MQSSSPSAVPLPVSPDASESDFEALINLLATDDTAGQDPGVSGTLKKSEVSHPAPDLRDEGGRLDFFKIKALFSSNGKNPRDAAAIPSRNAKGNVEDANPAQVDVTQALGSPLRTTEVSSLVLSQPPLNIVDSLSFKSGLPPVVAESTPLVTTHPLQYDNLDLIDLSSDHPPWASESKQSEPLPSDILPSFHGPLPPLESPPGSLADSLALAREEVVLLRKRIQELETLIYNSRDEHPPHQTTEHKRELESGEAFMLSKQEVHVEAGMQCDADELMTHRTLMINRAGERGDLNALSLAQTRFALKSLLNDLALPPSCISSLLIEGRKVQALPTSSLDEIHRAADLVTFVDELVWRRSRMGAIYDSVYSEENVQALRARLELWERTVRTRR